VKSKISWIPILISLVALVPGVVAGAPATSAAKATSDAQALKQLAQAIASESEADQIALTKALAATESQAIKKGLITWNEGGVYLYDSGTAKIPYVLEDAVDADGKQKADRVDTGEALKDDKGQPLLFVSSDLTAVDTSSGLRRAIQTTLDMLALADPDPQARRSAVMKLGMSQKQIYIPLLQDRQTKEKDKTVLAGLDEALALIGLGDSDPAAQDKAIRRLGEIHSIGSRQLLSTIANNPNSPNAKSASASVKLIDEHISWINFYGTLFRGLSEGSILLVAALGLAITFGLMGVINMAHGEFIAVGAYSAFVVQNIFGQGLALSPFGMNVSIPGMKLTGSAFDCYFIVALPLAFISAALVGLLLERSVIQFLYRRPLESLLATWGVSLMLQQAFRLIFGAANVQMISPSWLSGNVTIDDVGLGYNRLFVIGFAVVIVIATWLVLTKTPLGLLIRAVMQKRDMAACIGVRTERVNMMTFALGSGLAGLAGAFLSQIGNVGAGLGQTYIVDCFMTVVVGGVGNLVGTVCSALGIGVVDESLQPWIGPVMGKITVLAIIILFLQWRPAGLFVTKSRSLEG